MNTAPEIAAPKPASLLAPRIAVSVAFFLLGAGNGIWAVHIPLVQEKLAIDPAILGFALLVMATGAVLSMPLTGGLIGRFGSRIPAAALMITYTAVAPGPILAGNVPLFFTAIFLFGLFMGSLDVAANVQAAEVEAARRRPTMSSFHGFYSVGTLCGALIGAAVIGYGWGDGRGAATAAVLFLVLAALSAGHLMPSARAVEAGPRFALPNRAVLTLGLLTFLAFAAEGAVTDWGALFLTDVKRATPELAAIGYAAFALAMSGFRLFGDPIVARLGPKTTIIGGGLLIALGLAIAILMPIAPLSAAGFTLVGIGAANIVPVLFSESARTPGMRPGMGVAAVATLGYAGFLVAPPILGLVADGYGLSASLGLVVLMGLTIVAIGSRR